MYGWGGRVIKVDLTNQVVSEETLDEKIARKYIGGRGLGAHLLSNELSPNCDPLGPDNILVMATGPLTGTKAPTGARYMVMTKSPLTNGITCSNSGGMFPAELKKAGVDMIVFYGKSDSPVYLRIDQDQVELRKADHLWGKTTHETENLLLKETDPTARIASIGPGGEKLVLYATISNEKDRVAGRSGVGAVMGSKKLKAIAVIGKKQVPIWDEADFKKLTKEYTQSFLNLYQDKVPGLRLYGTADTIVCTQKAGCLPTRNCQEGAFDEWENIRGTTLREKYLKKSKSCFSCPIGCGRVTKVDDEGFEGEGEGPEYETLYSLGSMCGVGNLAAITKANYVCNELGIDTISLGVTIACAMELSEKGYLQKDEVGIGRKLEFGDAEAIVKLAEMTGKRIGFGDQLAEGSLRLATRYGHPELAMVTKGQEFAGYEPRGQQSMGLAYATSPIGASHMRGDPNYPETQGIPEKLNPYDWQGKAEIVRRLQDGSCIIDSAGVCVFFTMRALLDNSLSFRPRGILNLLNAATGANYTLDELEKAGARIFNCERMLMIKMGFSRKDDTLPKRILEEPMPSGPSKGNVCHLQEMLDEYYKLRGWDENGVPSEGKLKELGIV